MYQVKYGVAIGRETRIVYLPNNDVQAMDLFSQSQRRIKPATSNHGILPNDSVNYSG
jgi:hypothetical protein